MSEDGQQKYGQYENQVPIGSPLTTTTAKDQSACADICQASSVCNSAAFDSKDKSCALYDQKYSPTAAGSTYMESKVGVSALFKLPVDSPAAKLKVSADGTEEIKSEAETKTGTTASTFNPNFATETSETTAETAAAEQAAAQ
jgi:hypothetical protein